MPEPTFILDGFQAQAGSVLFSDGDAGTVVSLGLVLRAIGHLDQEGLTLQVAVRQEHVPALVGALLIAARDQPARG